MLSRCRIVVVAKLKNCRVPGLFSNQIHFFVYGQRKRVWRLLATMFPFVVVIVVIDALFVQSMFSVPCYVCKS